MAQTENFSVLCERLRSERLLVNNEQTILQNLNSKVQSELSELYKLIWICRHERVALHRLINSDPSVSPDNSCQLMAAINSSKFLEGYKGLGHHITATCQILKYLLESPRAVAEFLNAAQKLDSDIPMDELNRAIFNLLYGSCVFPTDEKGMVDLLGHLISLQLVTNSDPRRLLRKGSSTFSQMYKFFSEELFSAKIFLTAALHEPVMFLLSQDELFLDIDPSKSPIRFPAAERARRFGPDETSKLYKDRVARHRQIIVDKLVVIGNRFLKSIQNAMSCFPSSLTWLVRQLHTSLIEKKSHVTKEEAALICTDMIFTYFLCSAIINPEPLGIISDTPISHIARFNLIQVGQILQSLALLPYEQPASYMGELLNRFDQRVMPEIVRTILNSDSVSLESVFPNAVSDADGNEVYCRKACVGTLGEINVIHFYLKSPALNEINDAPLRKNLSNMLKKMPMELQCLHNESGCLKGNGDIKQSDSSSFTASSPSRSNSSGKLRHLADKVQTKVSQSHQRFMHNSNSTSRIHQRITQSLSSNFQQMNDLFSDKTSDSPNSMVDPKDARAEVFILPLVDNDVPLGLASEEAIMQSFARMYSSRKHKDSQDTDKKNKVAFVAASGSVVSDRTTDVASDEEEAEGASSASCSSNDNPMANAEGEEDDEAEDISTLPDNFSDIDIVPISANVSGRGSPLSISGERNSGRDTPFSGAAEQNDPLGAGSSFSNAPGVAIPVENRRNLPTLPVTVRKQNHEGLEEKFGKFGLPPAEPSKYRDETYSLVSDSWSTDVVASDNEGLSESRSEMPPMLALLQQPQHYFSGTRNMANPLHPSISNPPSTSSALSASNTAAGAANNNFLQSTPTTSSTESPNKYYDPENLEQCKAFSDAKRKLRLVLSSASNVSMTCGQTSTGVSLDGINSIVTINNTSTSSQSEYESKRLNDFLKILLAESINSRERTFSAQIREVQRCLTMFDNKGVRKLLRTLKNEHRKRTSYLLYLQNSRLTLLQLNYYLFRTKIRIQREKSLSAECLIEILVRFFLENKDLFLRQFIQDFQLLKAQDEKTDAVDRALRYLYERLFVEPMWRFATPDNIEYARKSLERSLMAHVYNFALFPNGEADHCRDEVFHKSMQKLSTIINVNHTELGIPKKFHGETPWPSAQAEIAIINAYKSPCDKMACVVRCCETIENLIALSSERGTASADDLLPVLVFVLLQANPPNLLSTIQYIGDFYSARMQGQVAYWWTQFAASVEFLKQLLNRVLL